MMRRLLADSRGGVSENLLGFSLTWFVIFFVFLMNVELGQLFYRRDVVDHVTSIATDTANKSYCKNDENITATEADALRAIDAVLDTAGGRCLVSVKPAGGAADPGAKPLDVGVKCAFPCKVPIAAQFMCKNGQTTMASKQRTVALGCDGKGG
jgi:hypothetical protein